MTAIKRLVDIELWITATAVLASMGYPKLLLPAVILAGLLFGLRRLATGSWGRSSGLALALLILVIMGGASMLITAFPTQTIPQILRLYTGISLFIAIIHYADRPGRLAIITVGVMLAVLGLAMAAPFSVTWATGKLPFIPKDVYERFLVLVQDAIHPNVLGGNLAILLPIPLAVILFQPRPEIARSWRMAAWGIAIIVAGVVLLSLSRGAMMGIGAALLLLIALRWRWGWLAIPAGLSASILLVSQIGIDRTLDILLLSNSVTGLANRMDIWKHAWYMVQDFPFTGIGMGGFWEVVRQVYPFMPVTNLPSAPVYHAHNLFLQVTVDLGVPGFVAWMAVLMAASVAAWRTYRFGRSTGKRLYACLGAGLLASQTALVVHGLTDAVTWGMVRPAPIVWGLWGMAIAAWLTIREEQTVREPAAPDPVPAGIAARPE